MTVTTVVAWHGNSYLKMTEKIGQAFNKSCWICTALPRGEGRVPMYGVATLNWTIASWVEYGKCKFGLEDKQDKPQKGPRFELLILDSTRSIFVDRKFDKGVGVGWRNLTGIGCSWEYGNSGIVTGIVRIGKWAQGTGCDPRTDEASYWVSDKNILGIARMATSFAYQEKMPKPCKLPNGYWWLCGDGHARKALPINWTGTCTVGYLVPQTTVHEDTPRGLLRTPWIRTRRTYNPLVHSTGFHSFLRILIPSLGVTQLEQAIVNISATLEIVENATTDALRAIQEEVSSLSKVVIQNRMALDILTAKEGGVCTIINQSCCVYLNKDLRIETDLRKIWEQTKVLHKASQDNIGWEKGLWDTLTSWLPNLGWVKQLFLVGIIIAILVLLISFTCIVVKCSMCLYQGTGREYEVWKRHELRQKVESGAYFETH